LVAIAQLLLESGRGASFVNELERHLERAPRAWRPWMLLAQCREQAGASAEALGAFEKAAKLAPAREIAPLVLLGEAARRNARPDLAQEAFTRALERDPTAARALLGLGHLAQQRGDFADAERRFRAALALEPDMYGAWEALSVMASGDAIAPLLAELDPAIASANDGPNAWLLNFARARLRERRGDYEGAFSDYVAGNRPRAPGDRYSRTAQND